MATITTRECFYLRFRHLHSTVRGIPQGGDQGILLPSVLIVVRFRKWHVKEELRVVNMLLLQCSVITADSMEEMFRYALHLCLICSGSARLSLTMEFRLEKLWYLVKAMIILVCICSRFYLDDPYILEGSCGVRFRLNRNADYYSARRNDDWHFSWNPFSWFDGFARFLFTVFSISVLLFQLFVIFFFVSMIGFNTILKIIFFPFNIIRSLFSCCFSYHVPYYPPPFFNVLI